MKIVKRVLFFIIGLASFSGLSQETLPIFQDYLSDNVYLVHPAAAGIGETGKIRAAIRMQGLGVANSPQIQTTNIHGKFGEESKAAFGVVLVNNLTNRSFAQKALQATYAYHLDIDQTENFEQLSLGLSVSGIQSEVGGQSFDGLTQINQPLFYLNVDFGAAYHFKGLSSYFTIKNAYLSTKEEIYAGTNIVNTINYVFGAGYFFGDAKKLQYEPSAMLQYKKEIGEKVLDVNMKVYKNFLNGQGWVAMSYRNAFGAVSSSDEKHLTTIVGINVNKMMFAYSYSRQLDNIILNPGSFHQISIGMNVLFGALKLDANPNINSTLF